MIAAKKGKIMSPDGNIKAFIDNTIVQVDDYIYTMTAVTQVATWMTDNSQMKTRLDTMRNRMHVAEGNIKKLHDKVDKQTRWISWHRIAER